MPDFEFAILGAGAMGSIIGAHLARAGHTVVMLARGERARLIAERGLTIRGLAEFETSVHTVSDPTALRSAHTLIVATKTPGTAQALATLRHAEFAVTVEDSWQGRGLGSAMMQAIEQCARDRNLAGMFGYVLSENDAMHRLMAARGYRARRDEQDSHVIRFELPLRDDAAALGSRAA